MIAQLIENLITYGLQRGLIEESDRVWVRNGMLDVLGLESLESAEPVTGAVDHTAVLEKILDWAYENGRLSSRFADHADLLDTRLMGLMTPRPSEVERRFRALQADSPVAATEWFYRLSRDCHYIRTDRVARNRHWTVDTRYGTLDITINRSKPEKDPKAIAAARDSGGEAYPACLLCYENVGYAGRPDHPARQNLRVIAEPLAGEPWYLQYSPYVYYNEHAILFSRYHVPMRIDRNTFVRLLEFTGRYPHYFVGSNADLPIVGGSMLSHDHYQGGRHSFAMERATEAAAFVLDRYPEVECRSVVWPLTVLRLRGAVPERLVDAAEALRAFWADYSDEAAEVRAFTGTMPHNTVTPIARRRGSAYELDLVLRNNRCDERYPDGIFHPHPEIHAVKKENIGLIEVMGLAVLPDRLETELQQLAEILEGRQSDASGLLERFALLVETQASLADARDLTVAERLRHGVGRIFTQGLEHCGVFKQTPEGIAALERFVTRFNTGA